MRERLTADERGVSEVVGAILVFGILVLLLSIIQTQAVPQQNQEVEFQHSIEVQSDLVQFHQIASSVAADGAERSVAFKTGTGYPSRLLLLNPPRVRGTVETTESRKAVIDNVRANDGEVNDYISDGFPSGSGNTLSLDTRRMQYRVDYNEIQNDPTIRYEYGVLYDEFDNGGEVVENDGTIIDGTSINLLYLTGEFSETSTTEQSLPVQPVSAPARSVTVEPTVDASGNLEPITLRLPTQLSEEKWKELYGSATNVDTISKPNPDTVEITLETGTPSNPKQYNLRMSKVALESDVNEPDPHYIVPVEPGVTSAGVGQPASIEYEVRDQFNNPVSDVEVDVPGGGTKTTDDQGRVSASVSTTQNQNFEAFLVDSNSGCAAPGSNPDDRCVANYRVQVPGLNLNPSGGITVESASTFDFAGFGSLPILGSVFADEGAEVTFESDSGSVDIVSIRMNHYSPDPEAHNQSVMIDPNDNDLTLNIGGQFNQPGNNFASIDSSGTTYRFAFEASVKEGDYFVLTVIFSDNTRNLYFISPSN